MLKEYLSKAHGAGIMLVSRIKLESKYWHDVQEAIWQYGKEQ